MEVTHDKKYGHWHEHEEPKQGLLSKNNNADPADHQYRGDALLGPVE